MKVFMSKKSQDHWLQKFISDESGSITVLTLLLFFTMFLVGGMAIDFLRFKNEYAIVQDVTDRAVLAATKLETSLDSADAEEVIETYFEASGIESNLVSTTVDAVDDVFREVAVEAHADIDTFVLPLAGIDDLESPVTATAMQGIGDIEISLVLDVSYSMTKDGPDKINNLRDAALVFAQEALTTEYDGEISLNVIPYSGAVNVGETMFDYLQGASFIDGVDRSEYVLDDMGTPDLDDDVLYPTETASCLLLEDSDYNTAGLPGSGRTQAPHFLANSAGVPWDAAWWCPQYDYSDSASPTDGAIRYAQRTVGDETVPGTLGYYLANLPMGFGTGTHDAVKYGLALLDPTSEPAFDHLIAAGEIDSVFSGRPLAYDEPGVSKVMVVMTDGQVWHTRLPHDPLDPDNLTIPVFDDPNDESDSRWYEDSAREENFTKFSAICEMAKEAGRDIQVFTIAFETTDEEAQIMEDCATAPGYFYEATGSGLTTVFAAIASQISELRLTE